MNMFKCLIDETNIAYTENGAKSFSTTKSYIVDLCFSQAGAMRNRSDDDIIYLFEKAFQEDALLTVKMAFYFRDVIKGQGERRLFRVIMKHLAKTRPNIVKKNLELTPQFGRWDDVIELFNTSCKYEAIDLISKQLKADLTSQDGISLMSKWLPSENASSLITKVRAKELRKSLKMSSTKYRKTLSGLRHKLSLVETQLTNKQYSEIDYNKVPSCANKKYMNAFFRNDNERYSEHIRTRSRHRHRRPPQWASDGKGAP